jgi:hypothetical protein
MSWKRSDSLTAVSLPHDPTTPLLKFAKGGSEALVA